MIKLIPVKKLINKGSHWAPRYFLVLDKGADASFDEVCSLIASRTTMTEGEVELVTTELHKIVIENAQMGRGTNLGRLGKVTVSLSSKSVNTLEEVSLDMVRKMNLIYKPSVLIKKALKKISFHIDKKLTVEE